MGISHRYTYVPSLVALPLPSHPIPPLLVVTEHQFELPESYSKFPVYLSANTAVYFTYGSVYVSMQLSPFVPPSPSPAVPTSLPTEF